MPALCIMKEGKELKNAEKFAKNIPQQEKALQKVLVENPELLQNSTDMTYKVITEELKLDCGDVDIFLVDSQGIPIIVEVKLAANPQCLREVIGQIKDYAASLSMLDYETLSRRVGKSDPAANKLEEIFRFFSDGSGSQPIYLQKQQQLPYELLKSRFEQRLREGRFRLIIAVDSAPNGLLRAWLAENAHSDHDIRLVVIQRFKMNDENEIIVPTHLVSHESHLVRNPKKRRQEFEDVLCAYDKIAPPDIKIRRHQANAALEVDDWGKFVHYEFTDWKSTNSIAIEIHVDLQNQKHSDKISHMSGVVKSFQNRLSKKIPFAHVRWCDNYKNFARLQFKFNGDLHPRRIADAMNIMITETRDLITKEFCDTSSSNAD